MIVEVKGDQAEYVLEENWMQCRSKHKEVSIMNSFIANTWFESTVVASSGGIHAISSPDVYSVMRIQRKKHLATKFPNMPEGLLSLAKSNAILISGK
jgi:hypothetical protein